MGNGDTLPAIRYPLLSILIRPQATIRHTISRNGGTSTLLLAALAGMLTAMGLLAQAVNDRTIHWFAAIVFCVAGGIAVGIVNLYIEGAATAWAGRILGGRATYRQVRTAIAWSSVPYAWLLPAAIAGLFVLHQDFLSHPLVVLLALVAVCWLFFLRIRTIGAVQEFGVLRSIASYVLEIVLLVLLLFPIRIFLFQPFNIPSSSMEPTVLAGDNIIVTKWSYGFSPASFPIRVPHFGRVLAAEPRRGDLVVFKVAPRGGIAGQKPVDYIKRLIGLPGDEIQMKNGVLVINSQAAQLQRVDEFETSDGRKAVRYRETLPDGVSYSIIDMTQNGQSDNTAVFKVPAGHYFMLGDNRDNSMDSRFPQIGYIPAESLVGRVALVHFSARKVTGAESWDHAFDNLRWDRMFRAPQ